ncbi:hypothetical protein Angca_001815, partial [Angiostrongylus cantonensis]
QPMPSPATCYDISGQRENRKLNDKVGNDLPSRDVDEDDDDDELVYTPIESPLFAAYNLYEHSYATPPTSNEFVLLQSLQHTTSYLCQTSDRNDLASIRHTCVEPNSNSYPFSCRDHLSHGLINSTVRQPDVEERPISDYVQVYHTGHYHNLNHGTRSQQLNLRGDNNHRNGIATIRRINPNNELDYHPIRYFVDVRHSGFSYMPRIRRLRHPGHEEVRDVKPSDYTFETISKARLERLQPSKEITAHNIREYSLVYHPGYSHVFPRKSLNGNIPPIRLVAKILPTSPFLKKSRNQTQNSEFQDCPVYDKSGAEAFSSKEISKPQKFSVPKVYDETAKFVENGNKSQRITKNEEKRNFALETTEKWSSLPSSPHTTNKNEVVNKEGTHTVFTDQHGGYSCRRWKYGCHEDVEKDRVRKEAYGVASMSHNSPPELTNKQSDLQSVLLREHVQAYLHGQSWDAANDSETDHNLSASTAKKASEEDTAQQIRLAPLVAHNRSADNSVSTKLKGRQNDDSTGFLGFWEPGSRMLGKDSVGLSAYPSSDKYVGPLDDISCRKDIDKISFDVPAPAVYEPTAEHHGSDHHRVHLVTRWRHGGDEEVVEKDHVRPETYGIASTSYDGPLELTTRESDLLSTPLEEHAQVYHHGQSWDAANDSKTDHNLSVSTANKPSEEVTARQIRLIARVPHNRSADNSVSTKLKGKRSEDSTGLFRL